MSNSTLASICRLEGRFKLNSGIESNVKWDIELLFKLPYNDRVEILKPWLEQIKNFSPEFVVGIPTGGLYLADDVGNYLDILSWSSDGISSISKDGILVDDVLTTGYTIKKTLNRLGGVKLITVLVNRSNIKFINNIPVLYSICSDIVKQ